MPIQLTTSSTWYNLAWHVWFLATYQSRWHINQKYTTGHVLQYHKKLSMTIIVSSKEISWYIYGLLVPWSLDSLLVISTASWWMPHLQLENPGNWFQKKLQYVHYTKAYKYILSIPYICWLNTKFSMFSLSVNWPLSWTCHLGFSGWFWNLKAHFP